MQPYEISILFKCRVLSVVYIYLFIVFSSFCHLFAPIIVPYSPSISPSSCPPSRNCPLFCNTSVLQFCHVSEPINFRQFRLALDPASTCSGSRKTLNRCTSPLCLSPVEPELFMLSITVRTDKYADTREGRGRM